MTVVFTFRHIGPGPHPSGTPQSVHAGNNQPKAEVAPDEKAKHFETVYFAKANTQKVHKGMRPKKGVKSEPQEAAVDVAARLDDTQVQVIQGAGPGGPAGEVSETSTGVKKGKKGKEPKPPMDFHDVNDADQAGEFLKSNGIVRENVRITDLDAPIALHVANVLTHLVQDFGVVPDSLVAVDGDPQEHIWATTGTLSFNGWTEIELISNEFNHQGQDNYYEESHNAHIENATSREVAAGHALAEAKRLASEYEGDAKLQPLAKDRVERFEEAMKVAQAEMSEAKKFSRNNVATPHQGVRDVVTHEYGHVVLNAANKAAFDAHQSFGDWETAVRNMKEDGSIYRVSKYAARDMKECFAECFVMYRCGEKDELPDYMVRFIEKAISLAQNKETSK